MPVYFIHVKHDGGLDEDLEGMSFDNVEEAMASAGDMLRDVNRIADDGFDKIARNFDACMSVTTWGRNKNCSKSYGRRERRMNLRLLALLPLKFAAV